MVRFYALLVCRSRGCYDWLQLSLDVSCLTSVALQRSLTLPQGQYYLVQQVEVTSDDFRIYPLLKIDGLSAKRSRTR